MLGTDGDAGGSSSRLFPLINAETISPRNRFSIAPEDFRAAEHACNGAWTRPVGVGIILIRYPARPSEFDREHAWPWYSYVIVSVKREILRIDLLAALEDDRSKFQPEEVLPVRAASQGKQGLNWMSMLGCLTSATRLAAETSAAGRASDAVPDKMPARLHTPAWTGRSA